MNEKDQNIYRLWVEYLKRSEDYKTICLYVAQNKDQLPLAPLPDKLKGKGNLVTTYLFFGDVHAQSLNDILFSIEMWKEIFLQSSPLKDYSNQVESDIDKLIRLFKKINKREPRIEELKNSIIQLMKYSSAIYLKVELSVATMGDLKKHFSEILKEQKRRLKEIPSLMPLPNIRLEEVERYLRIFDYRKDGLRWDEIMKIEPHKKTALNNERAFKRDLHNAKNIIKNAEKGVFPKY